MSNDFLKINLPSPASEVKPEQPERTAEASREFQQLLQSETASINDPQAATVEATPRTFTAAELQDPHRLQEAVRLTLQDLLQADFRKAGLAPPEQQALIEWMVNDPVMRALSLDYLRQTVQS